MIKVYSGDVYRARLEPVEGSEQESVALAFQMRALDVSRFGKVSVKTLEALADAVLSALGIIVEP